MKKVVSNLLTYHIVSNWQVDGTVEEVSAIFRDTANLQNWWPAAFLRTVVLEEGEEGTLGKLMSIHAKGWAPYSMKFEFTVSELVGEDSFLLQLEGDFNGRAICSLKEVGQTTSLELDWKVRVSKPVLILGSIVAKPALCANHLWAMKQGEKSLQIEIDRRKAFGLFEKPPGPTFPHNAKPGSLLYKLAFRDGPANQLAYS